MSLTSRFKAFWQDVAGTTRRCLIFPWARVKCTYPLAILSIYPGLTENFYFQMAFFSAGHMCFTRGCQLLGNWERPSVDGQQKKVVLLEQPVHILVHQSPSISLVILLYPDNASMLVGEITQIMNPILYIPPKQPNPILNPIQPPKKYLASHWFIAGRKHHQQLPCGARSLNSWRPGQSAC